MSPVYNSPLITEELEIVGAFIAILFAIYLLVGYVRFQLEAVKGLGAVSDALDAIVFQGATVLFHKLPAIRACDARCPASGGSF